MMSATTDWRKAWNIFSRIFDFLVCESMREYIAGCVKCSYNRTNYDKPEGNLHYGDLEPLRFRQIHLDGLDHLSRVSEVTRTS